MGEGDSSSGDDEDSDSDSDPGPGLVLDRTGNGVGVSRSGFQDCCTELHLDERSESTETPLESETQDLIVISDLKRMPSTQVRTMGAREFLASSFRDTFVVNVSHDYRYMKMGYYVSLHAELLGNPVMPKCSDVLDVYRTPILLLRALKAGIPAVPHFVTNSAEDVVSKFDLPVMVFPVKPFSPYGFRIAHSKSALYGVVKRLTMNRRYTVCVQPLLGELVSFKSFFGVPVSVETGAVCGGAELDMSQKIHQEFRVPMYKFYAQREGDRLHLCGVEPLKNHSRLSRAESRLIEEGIVKAGEKLGK